MTPEGAAELILSVYTLKDTTTVCDLCSRDAKYAVFNGNQDNYLCVPHTAAILERRSFDLRHLRHVG